MFNVFKSILFNALTKKEIMLKNRCKQIHTTTHTQMARQTDTLTRTKKNRLK